MVETVAKYIIVAFGAFFIIVGLTMLFKPRRARRILEKAGSTNFINYAEITLRMIPAIALIIAADISKYPLVFQVFGWFMLCTSIVLYFVPRQMHHNFSTRAASILKPIYFQLISPLAILIGMLIIYSIF